MSARDEAAEVLAARLPRLISPAMPGQLADALADAGLLRDEQAERRLRDLTMRLGFGDNITEPMADNDTIVAWFEQQSRDANEWQESQLWRNDCYMAGHDPLEDCFDCDPARRLEQAEQALARVEALTAPIEDGGPTDDEPLTVGDLRAALRGDR